MHDQVWHTSKKRKGKIMITEHIIMDISVFLRTDKSEIESVIENVKTKRYLQMQDVRQLQKIGIPVIPIISSIMKVNTEQAFCLIGNCKISYQDIMVILGIIAQDLKLRSQGR